MLLALLLSLSVCHGQNSFGISIGLNRSSVLRGILPGATEAESDTSLFPLTLGEHKQAFGGGIYGRLRLNRYLTYHGELNYSRKGLYNPYEDLNADVDYLTAPQFLKVRVLKIASIGIGFKPAFMLSSRNWGELVVYEKIDWSILGSVWIETPLKGLSLSARYSRGLTGFMNLGFGPLSGIDESREYVHSVFNVALHYDPFALRRSYRNDPPILEIGRVVFVDKDGNQTINADEDSRIEIEIKNSGFGIAEGVVAYLTITGQSEGLKIPKKVKIENIKPEKSVIFSIPISSNRETSSGALNVTVNVVEPNGFNPISGPISVTIETKEFDAPRIEVVDLDIPQLWRKGNQIRVNLMVQNTGAGLAEKVELQLNSNKVLFQDPREPISIKRLPPGASKALNYKFMVPSEYNKSNVDLELLISERFGEYGINWKESFELEKSSQSVGNLVIESFQDEVDLETAYLPQNITFNAFSREDTIERIFVFPKPGIGCLGEEKDGQDLASTVESLLLGEYDILERRYFEQILDEQRRAASGILFEDTAVELGCNQGSQGILFVEEGCLDGKRTISLKLVGCQTAAIYWTCLGFETTAFETISKVKYELNKEE